MLEPEEFSPEWLLNDRIEDIARLFASVADHFEMTAKQVEFNSEDVRVVHGAKARGEEVPCTKVAIAWKSLSDKALAMEPFVIEELHKFKRAGRQIIVIEEKKAIDNSSTVRARDGRVRRVA